MSSTSTSTNNNNNSNSNNNNSNSNNNNIHHTEQPQTKRQKIEKIKGNVKNCKITAETRASTINKTLLPPPDIIDTGGGCGVAETMEINGSAKLLSSSLSSSANSISTPSSYNNSPTSTPSSSRAASLTQLLNVQNIVNNLPSNGIGNNGSVFTNGISSSSSIKSGNSSRNCTTESGCSSAGSSEEQSADEVDRVALTTKMLAATTALHMLHGSPLPNGKAKSLMHTHMHHNGSVCVASAADVTMTCESSAAQDMREFEESLTRQCLCGVSERTLRKPFQSHYSVDAHGQKRIANLSEWPTNKLMQFLSNLQLLFDIFLKQNSKGFICARIMDVCDALVRNDHNLIDEIIVLAGYTNTYVQFLAGRVLASFLVIAKQEMDDDWLKKLVANLFNFERLDYAAVQIIHFSLEILRRIVEWKDVDLHPLEDEIADTQCAGGGGVDVGASTGMHAEATAGPSGSSSSAGVLDVAHSYMHFQTQQATLQTNYFAVHLRASGEAAATVDHAEHNNESGGASARHRLQHYNDLAHIPATNTFALPHSTENINPYHQHHIHYDGVAAAAAVAGTAHHFTTSNSANASGVGGISAGCHIITLTDSESFDTTQLKCITIQILENKWPALVKNMSTLIENHLDIENAENCILNFLQLWESIISVKANLSIVETLPFYAQLDKFELLLNQHLSCTVYKQMLCLFNEALCYGSTLALQDMLPDETCLLAHQIVRHVKDFRILDSLPRRQPENFVSLIGFKRHPIVYAAGTLQSPIRANASPVGTFSGSDVIEMDKTILQKIVLLVLKSIAVTVKEIRSDSSDSSIDSADYDAHQDMVLIERSIRDVLVKLEAFIKHKLEFHPECHFSKILIHLFDDQDDHLIEAMVCTLDVTAGISFRNNAFPDLVTMLNPVYTFLEFLKMISDSSDLLLEFLVSNETCFLLYLLRFLKYIRMNWAMFLQSCHNFGGAGSTTIDSAMSVLIRLRLQISRLVSRSLYPYDISPVLRLLESCESLYEGNELS